MTTPNVLYSLLGHKGRVFDIRYGKSESTLLSGSEDGKTIIWDIMTRKSIATLSHSIDTEILRVCEVGDGIICNSCSNGECILWKKSTEGKYINTGIILQHNQAQIYSSEEIIESDSSSTSNTKLMTAADDVLRIWDLSTYQEMKKWSFQNSDHNMINFGGPRNPDNINYIFDAKSSPKHPTLLSVALSDGTARLIDIRVNSESITLGQPSSIHSTSIAWTSDGNNLLLCFGNGDIGIIDLRMNMLRAVLRGHQRSCFGASMYKDVNHCISWSSDGTLKSWDVSIAQGIFESVCGEHQFSNFPLYCCLTSTQSHNIFCAGGNSSNVSFLGIPIPCIDGFYH